MKYLLFVFCLFTFAFPLMADHYLGANISYKSLGNMSFEVTITAYQDEDHPASDKDGITVYWGDNTSSIVPRTNGSGDGVLILPDMRKSVFVGTHQYTSEGNYKMYISESYRHASILNIAGGQSATTKLYVDAIVPVYTDPTICANNSVQYQLDPIFFANKNLEYSLNPGAFDPDGDSLVFELGESRGANGTRADNYFVPSGATVNAATGTLTWTVPFTGDYSFCILIHEYRGGKKIGVTSSDFLVSAASNFSVNPVFTGANVHHLNEGDALNYPIKIDYPSATNLSYTFWNSSFGGVTQKQLVDATSVKDTIDWSTTTGDGKSGTYVFVHRVQNTTGGKTILKDFAVAVHVYGDLPLNCTVPDISEVVDVAPELFDFSVAPTLFDEYVWVNVGTTEGAEIYLYDIQGKLLEKYTDFAVKTVQLDLSTLASAVYVLVLNVNDKTILTQRLIKR
ncbi:MAG: T9SS type A sorting domain-containing protein [Flavobacteriales bacterium]